MDHKPKKIIQDARNKAERVIFEACAGEILRIVDAFVYDTGVIVDSVSFDFMDVSMLGGAQVVFRSDKAYMSTEII